MKQRSNPIKHQRIVNLAKSHDEIYLLPEPPRRAKGHIEHYYHFVFDLLLPLSLLIKQLPTSTTLLLPPFGIFERYLDLIYPGRTRRVAEERVDKKVPRNRFVGMNPNRVELGDEMLAEFRDTVMLALGIKPCEKPDKVLLIERMPPDEYFRTQSNIRGGGSARRAILNHAELQQALQKSVDKRFNFMNVRLEEITFAEQVALFDSAIAVIGQHGAGLANNTWMKPGGQVYEIAAVPEGRSTHFEYVSLHRGLHHYRYKTGETLVQLDVSAFMNWLADKPGQIATPVKD